MATSPGRDRHRDVRPDPGEPALGSPKGRTSRHTTEVHGGVGSATVPEAPAPAVPADDDDRRGRLPRWARAAGVGRPLVTAGFVLAVVAGVVLRFVTTSPLWLDEAQSVAIARLPLPQLFDALRQDGSPPLYYLLLHVWIGWFGQGAFAVRSLSALFGVLVLPLAWRLTRQLAGRRTAQAVLLLLATSPFAVRYSSETRMYSLMVLLSVLLAMAVRQLFRRPGFWPVAGVALTASAIALTHYWGFYLLAVVAVLAVALLRRYRGPMLRLLAGLVVSGLVFLPWLPSFLTQMQHTGTPWAGRGGLQVFPVALTAWRGGNDTWAWALGVLQLLLLVVGLLAVPRSHVLRRPTLLLELRIRPSRSLLLAAFAGTLFVAGVAGWLTHSATVARYTSVALVPFVGLVALGAVAMPTAVARRTALAVAAVLGLVTVLPTAWTPRTQAAETADGLQVAAPGDLVVFCPDQLGPAVSRLVQPGLDLVVYPDLRPAGRVDWTDYAARNTSRTGAEVAAALVRRAQGSAIWVVSSSGYIVPSAARCNSMIVSLEKARGQETVYGERGDGSEGERLVRFAPARG
jgi:mannosyltransferase